MFFICVEGWTLPLVFDSYAKQDALLNDDVVGTVFFGISIKYLSIPSIEHFNYVAATCWHMWHWYTCAPFIGFQLCVKDTVRNVLWTWNSAVYFRAQLLDSRQVVEMFHGSPPFATEAVFSKPLPQS